jgi:PAS domain S-box-containing protein
MGSDSGLRRGSLSAVTEQVGTEFLTRLAEQSHIVQFYESDDNLCGLVSDYLAAGLSAGEPLVVIATEPHRAVFCDRLREQGIDIDHASAQGRVRFLDARETLSRLMVDAMPDWERFERVVGGEIDLRRGGNRGVRVRAYGEMVDVLWRDGNEKAAIRLEEMWNQLGRENPVSLLCAYVMGSFYKEGHDGGHPATLHQLCARQAEPRPAEPPRPAGNGRRPTIGPTARRARRLAAEIEHRKEVEKALRGSLQELRRAEEALRESQSELQDFVDNAAEGMEWLDPDGVVLWANRAQLDLLGCSEAEYVGHHVSDFHVDRDAVDEFFACLAAADTVRDHEVRVRCNGGAIKHVLINANVYRKDGHIVHTRCFSRDITARKRAHDALMRLQAITASLSEARTQAEVLDVVTRYTIAVSGALGASVYLLASDGETLELARAVGYAERAPDRAATIPLDAHLPLAEAARRAVPMFLLHGEVRERYPAFEDTSGPTGARSLARLPLIVDGRTIGVLGVSHGEPDAFGENEQAFLIALAHQCAQALERARLYDAESRARRSAEASQHRSAFLSKVSAILSSSLDYEATLTNLARLAVPRIADWCLVELASADQGSQLVVADGDPAQVARLRELRARFPPDRDAPVGVARVLESGRSELHREFSDALLASFTSDREHQGFLCQLKFRSAIIVPMTARGRTLGAIALISAQSERRFEPADLDMAEELGHRAAIAIDNARLYQEAREADRRKDEFLAMLGHELRNPLAPIMTGLKLMQLRGVGGDRERQIIERQVKYLVHLVDDLLDVSRITRGKVELNKEPLELATVLAKAIEMASPLYEERAHQLTVDVPRKGLLVEADPIRLAQILANLMTNAAKYTDPHGRVVVSARREGGQVAISVADSGIGISPSVLPQIFDMFVQGDRALDRSQGGLGIGLTLARSLVEAHGGTISAHSAGLGLGSEFTVRLPSSTGRAATEREPDGGVGEDGSLQASGVRILVVDDNTDAADVLADVLRAAGHEVAVAYDGPHALGLARTFQPNAALLDIGLPVLDGYELAERLRELLAGRALRLVAVTGYGQETDKDRSRAAGFDAHLVKPIDVRSLVALLDGGDGRDGGDDAASP